MLGCYNGFFIAESVTVLSCVLLQFYFTLNMSKGYINAIDYAMCSGVKGIFTAHGKDIDEIKRNPELSNLLDKHIFERVILLNPKKRGDAECYYL